jgi:hypothetical protein
MRARILMLVAAGLLLATLPGNAIPSQVHTSAGKGKVWNSWTQQYNNFVLVGSLPGYFSVRRTGIYVPQTVKIECYAVYPTKKGHQLFIRTKDDKNGRHYLLLFNDWKNGPDRGIIYGPTTTTYAGGCGTGYTSAQAESVWTPLPKADMRIDTVP